MKCPVCNDPDLMMSDRQGIEIDYCPKCRGVWLDRGELDKIIERTAAEPPARSASAAEPYEDRDRHYDPRRDHDDRHKYPYGKKKRRGLLGELFDFD